MIHTAMFIPVAAFFILPLGTLVYLVKIHRILRKMGRYEDVFPRHSGMQFIGLLVCTPILVSVSLVRKFDLVTEFAVCTVGVLGFLIAVRDILYARQSGLYENGIVWNGVTVFFADIDEITRPDPFTLVIQTRNRTRHSIIPDDERIMSTLLSRFETAGILLQ